MRHLTPHHALLYTLLTASLLLHTPVHAVETLFEHRFRFERADNDDAAFANASQAMAGVAFGGSSFTRWSTRTIVAQFGMEAGGRVDVDVRELSSSASLGQEKQHVPLVFTLYDSDQWRVYSVLQLREVPLRSPAILCHYPSCMRFAVTTGDSEQQLKERRKVAFVVSKASLYTLQMQVCGDASVHVKVYIYIYICCATSRYYSLCVITSCVPTVRVVLLGIRTHGERRVRQPPV